MLRLPLLPVLALALAAGVVLAVGYGTARTAPARVVTPDAATPSPSANPPAPSTERSEPKGVASAARSKRRTPRRPPSVRTPAHRRPAVPRGPRPRPPAKHKPRTARPASPAWITAECRRRFPHDAFRRRACAAVLTDQFGR